MLLQPVETWDFSDVAETKVLRGRSLYEALIQLKPDGLAETDWAVAAGVNRGFFSNLKAGDNAPRSDTLRKLLAHVGKSEADLYPDPASENAVVQKFEGASMERMRPDLPILGTALGADRIVDDVAIEQTYLYTHDRIGYARRPVILDGRADAYGIYVQGSSMEPVHQDGALILVEGNRPPRIGDDVIVYLRKTGEDQDGDDGETARTALVKRLVRRNSSYIELEQFNPAIRFRIEMREVLKVHRVMTLADLLS